MNNRGIRFRVLLLALLPLALVATGLTGYFMLARYGEMDRSLEERTLAMASQLAQSCEFALFSGNEQSLDQLARPLSKSGDIRGVTVADRVGHPIVHIGQSRYTRDFLVREAVVAMRDKDALLVVAPVMQQVIDIDGMSAPAEVSRLGYVA